MRLRKVVFLLLTTLLLVCSASAMAECKLFWDSRNGQHRQVCQGCETHKRPTYVTKWEDHAYELRGVTWPSKVEPTDGVMPQYITITWDRYNSMRICPVCGDKTEIIPDTTEKRAYLLKSTAVTCTTDGSYTYQQAGVTWSDITLSPEKTYKVKALGHDWSNKNGRCARKGCNETCPHEAAQQRLTCTQGTDCAVCGAKLFPLGHDWSNKDGHCARTGCTATCSHENVQQKCTETVDCAVCRVTLPALTHDLVPHPAQAATCTEIGWDAYETCTRCDYTTYQAIDALNHDLVPHPAQAVTCTEIGWDAYETCTRCDYTTYQPIDALNHDLVSHAAQAATCTEKGWEAYDTCTRCTYSTYTELPALGHDLVHHDAQAPTCTEIGWNAYNTCTRCDYTTHQELAALGHWYGQWPPNTDNTHSASCRRTGCSHAKTVACAQVACKLPVEDQTALELTLCPVCGRVSDGTCLALVEDASATGKQLPRGELLVRMGETASGERLMTACFESGGRMLQAKKAVKMTLPAALLNGVTLAQMNADGTQTPLSVQVDGESASVTPDFAQGETPALLIRLVPAA